MSQKLPVDGFKWVEEDGLLKFNESFIENYDENSNKGYILVADVEQIQKIFISCIVTYHFYLKERKLKNVISLFELYKTENAMLFT